VLVEFIGGDYPRAMSLVTTALLFLIGYASQRAGVCMVRAVREVIERRRVNRLAGFLLSAASAMVVMGLAKTFGASPFDTIFGTPPDALVIAGGVLFGLGSLINGHCAMGTLAALTTGELSRLATIAALFVAALLLGPSMSSAALLLPDRPALVSPLAGNAARALILGSMLAAVSAGYIYRRLRWNRPKGGWSPLIAMTLIGAASGLLFALDRQWVYTSRIAEVAYGGSWTLGALSGLAALIVGMTSAGVIGGTFRWQAGSGTQWLRAGAGGLLMGVGATLVPGGNDAMLFTGVPLLLPNLLVGYASFALTLTLALLIRRRSVPMGA
jgi:uncharacterized membrane protein YedE/YeeE